MSILTLNQDNAGKLCSGIQQFHGLWNVRNYVDSNNEGKLNFYDLSKRIERLYMYNELCFKNRYRENMTVETPKITYKLETAYNPCQCLKTLQCLRYNIEEEYLGEILKVQLENDLKFLDILIDSITTNIIHDLDDYRNAKWGE